MASGYKYPVLNSNGTPSSTIEDFDDNFVSKDTFLNSGLWACGNNSAAYGYLGTSNTTPYSSPVQIGSLTNWKLVNSGGYAGAIKTDGTLWLWGRNNYGQCGLGDTVNRSSPVQVGSLTNWKLISGGMYSTTAIKTDGSLWTWGYNNSGQLGYGATTIRYSSPVQVGLLTNWKQVSSGVGSFHTAAVKTDGTLWTWGYNNTGQLGQGNITALSSPVQVGSLTNWKQVVATGQGVFGGPTLAVKTDGTLWSWGHNSNGQLGLGDTVPRSSPVQVGSLTNWRLVSTGIDHSMAVKTDGTLWGWGQNSNGQLGDGTNIARTSPVQIGVLTNWKFVSAGYQSTSAIKTDGTLWMWGDSKHLGLGDTVHRSSPVQVGSLANWKHTNGGNQFGIISINSAELP